MRRYALAPRRWYPQSGAVAGPFDDVSGPWWARRGPTGRHLAGYGVRRLAAGKKSTHDAHTIVPPLHAHVDELWTTACT